MIAVLWSTFCTGLSFYLLLSVVPVYATSVGSGIIGAGMVTSLLMLATVGAELATPELLTRFGYRAVLAAGLVLLGLPDLGLPVSTSMPAILVVSMLRGVGLAIAFVTNSALVALVVPAARRGEALGVMGMVSLIPSVVAFPLGLWLAQRLGYTPVFLSAAASALAGLGAVHGLPSFCAQRDEPAALVGVLRSPALIRPSLVFVPTAMAAGSIATFLPIAVRSGAGSLAAAALFAQAISAALGRWWAGRYGDVHGHAGLLTAAAFASSLGLFSLVVIGRPITVLFGMVLFGAGFGVSQNASLALIFERASARGYGAGSALWNLAYDTGLGLGCPISQRC